MKSFLAVASAFTALAIASQASAADLAAPTAPVYSKAPEYVQRQVSNWTGFYVGGDVGGIFQNGDGSSNFSSTTPELILFERPALASALAGPLAVDDTRGFSSSKGAVSGGVHAGYNYQFAPNFLVGIEADWQATGIRNSACRGTNSTPVPCANVNDGNDLGIMNVTTSTRSITTLRGRFGWVNDNILFYSTGGAAWADVQNTVGLNCPNGCAFDRNPFAGSATTSTFKAGWVAGAGIEWMPVRNWIVRAEYLHVDAGSVTTTLDGSAICNCTASATQNLRYDIVRAGFSYKFW